MSTLPAPPARSGVEAAELLGKPDRPRLIVDNTSIQGIEAELARARDAYDRARTARDQAKRANDDVERSAMRALMDIALIRAKAVKLWPCPSDHILRSATRGLR